MTMSLRRLTGRSYKRLSVISGLLIAFIVSVYAGLYYGRAVHKVFEPGGHQDSAIVIPDGQDFFKKELEERRSKHVHKDDASSNSTDKTIITNPDCKHSFGKTLDEDLAKISSYKFEGVQKYIDELFPTIDSDPVSPELPVFVTAFSSNHHYEGTYLFKDINEIVRPKYKNLTVILYDIGMTSGQVKSLNATCSCEIRTFQFDKYPKHVRHLNNFAWKSIIVQTVVKEGHPFVVWMDASVRWKTGNLDDMFKDAKANGLMVDYGGQNSLSTIAERTLKPTFDFLQEEPCIFSVHTEIAGGLYIVYANTFITKYYLRPLVSCALSIGCMEPTERPTTHPIICRRVTKPFTYHNCHRYDQSINGILSLRLFHREIMKHAINRKYFMFCGSPVKNSRVCTYFDE